ncbi:MAG: hypothetical protein CMA83_03805 [Euryarchaeota archaeon]|nr:hypothetical protein [Euryarchaeota archaeon]|tara:strand:- start:5495 stop:5695 length:201 start_codon:yes stop_codon:yes gene_type:complete
MGHQLLYIEEGGRGELPPAVLLSPHPPLIVLPMQEYARKYMKEKKAKRKLSPQRELISIHIRGNLA